VKGPRGKVASNTGWSGKEICIGTTQGSSVIFVRSELEAVEPGLSSRSLATASPRHLALARRLPRQLSDSGDRTGRPRSMDREAAAAGHRGRGQWTGRPRLPVAAACVRPRTANQLHPRQLLRRRRTASCPPKQGNGVSQTPLVNVARPVRVGGRHRGLERLAELVEKRKL